MRTSWRIASADNATAAEPHGIRYPTFAAASGRTGLVASYRDGTIVDLTVIAEGLVTVSTSNSIGRFQAVMS